MRKAIAWISLSGGVAAILSPLGMQLEPGLMENAVALCGILGYFVFLATIPFVDNVPLQEQEN